MQPCAVCQRVGTRLREVEGERLYLDQCINGLHGWKQIQAETATKLAQAKQRVAVLQTALQELVSAEWMMSHDWGGDREAVMEKARAALTSPPPAQEEPMNPMCLHHPGQSADICSQCYPR